MKVELVCALPALESGDCAERSALRAPDRPRCAWEKAGNFRKISVMRGDQRNTSGKRNSTARAAAAESLQSCPTLCDPVPGILQTRTLEWDAISFSNA